MSQKQENLISIKELLEAGAHFGHQSQRWNPKMKRFIFGERNGIYIIDLAKTMVQFRAAVQMVQDVIAQNKSVIFVGTKKQAKSLVRELAEGCEEFYVCERWLGGMLTNLKTIRQSVKRLEEIEKRISLGGEGLNKKELSLLDKSRIKLDKNLSGIRSMRKLPGLVFVIDPAKEHIAVAEARKLGIPVMALVDTNADPDIIDLPIPANDDSIKCVRLIMSALTDVIMKKKKEMNIKSGKDKKEDEKVAVSADKEDEVAE
ncbi:MAG: 30S ribosomal protein S2 [Chlamydiia bacterium]|nr:30S ribosomal protein S2 [Chlamydiia bacterium]